MRRPPYLSEFHRYPVTAGTILLAAGITAAWHKGIDISVLLETPDVNQWQLWRLVTSALPHGRLFHLFFNLAWLWALGTIVEGTLGRLKTLALFIILALGSNAAEYALFHGGVGLSGVLYGLAGMLWVLSRRDGRFFGAMDNQSAMLLVIWFFVCIVTTWTGSMSVGNVAHGMGAILGLAIGQAMTAPRLQRPAFTSLFACLLVANVAGATIGRPWVNLARFERKDEATLAYEALAKGDNTQAVQRYSNALKRNPNNPANWYNLGVAHWRLGHQTEAARAFQEAFQRDPHDATYRKAALETRPYYVQPGLPTTRQSVKSPSPGTPHRQ